jgi:hypothetical protein
VDVRFTKSVIASKCAFTYEEAQIRKDDPFVGLLAPSMIDLMGYTGTGRTT